MKGLAPPIIASLALLAFKFPLLSTGIPSAAAHPTNEATSNDNNGQLSANDVPALPRLHPGAYYPNERYQALDVCLGRKQGQCPLMVITGRCAGSGIRLCYIYDNRGTVARLNPVRMPVAECDHFDCGNHDANFECQCWTDKLRPRGPGGTGFGPGAGALGSMYVPYIGPQLGGFWHGVQNIGPAPGP